MVRPAMPERFCSCIKKVWKTRRFKSSSAIAICVKSVIQGTSRRRTLRRFSCRGKPSLSVQAAKEPKKPKPSTDSAKEEQPR